MIKTFGKRIAAMVVASAVVAGVTVTYGIPNIKYKEIKSSEPVVMTVNGDEIHMDEFRAYLKYNKSYMENMLSYYGMDDTIWSDPTMGEMMVGQLFESANQQAIEIHTVKQEFEKLGLKLSREEREQAQQEKMDTIEQMGGQELFEQWLQSIGYNDTMYDNTIAISKYANAIQDAYYGDNGTKTNTQAIVDKFNETYLCAKHILVQSIDGSGNPLTGDALAAAQSKAQEALEKVKAGEDFDTLIAQYNEDPGMEMYPEGYVFTEGEMVDEFYQGTKALEPGQTSTELVESGYGWHIIQREPLTAEQLNDTIREQLVQEITGQSFVDEIQNLMSEVDVQYTDTYGEKTYDNLMQILGDSTTENTEDAAPSEDAAQQEQAAE
nr:peptidylprolyl isomerase [uncultured Butyricicoccus sp.]